MNRRQFLLGSATTVTLLSAGALAWLLDGTGRASLTIDNALINLDKLVNSQIKMTGAWNLSQVLTHCAQSIEFSMLGFPEHKSELFKQTVGKVAFAAFAQKGEMHHNLSEAIPGAAILSAEEDVEQAYLRFKQAMLDFKQYSGELAEHFAFGQLTKAEYEQAHVMHFYNHLQQVEWINEG